MGIGTGWVWEKKDNFLKSLPEDFCRILQISTGYLRFGQRVEWQDIGPFGIVELFYSIPCVNFLNQWLKGFCN